MTQRGVGDLFSFTGLNAVTVRWKAASLWAGSPRRKRPAALLPQGFNHVCSPGRVLQSSFSVILGFEHAGSHFTASSPSCGDNLCKGFSALLEVCVFYPSQPLIKINSLTGELWVLNCRKLEHAVQSGEEIESLCLKCSTPVYIKQIKWKYRSEWAVSGVIKRCDLIPYHESDL